VPYIDQIVLLSGLKLREADWMIKKFIEEEYVYWDASLRTRFLYGRIAH